MRVDIRQHSDIILALFVVAVAAMLLVPLPTPLLDILLVLNISFSLLLLLVGLYLPNALALLSFPSLLLLTTLFRLSLNVASARLILSQGDAGRVIQAFGTFLVRGEVVVGVIIFTIITIVNFIVIARGAGRVSEVAARFALDALPGKQIAIDADVRAGLISAAQAQERREDLRRESQLYGAMDGAMKFVQGDAIAGFFIILTNIIGGIYIGISRGLGFAEAVQTYTVLTVGDGLVTQIPALLISICAGIVVTRVSSREGSTLSSDVGSQIFRRPATVLLAGVLLLGLSLLPGLPKAPFITIALLFIGLGVYLKRVAAENSSHLPLVLDGTGSKLTLSGVPQLEASDSDARLQIALDEMVLFRLYDDSRDAYDVFWQDLRLSLLQEIGIKLPTLNVVSEANSGIGHFAIFSNDTLVVQGDVPLDSLLVEINPGQAQILGLEVIKEEDHPIIGNKIAWVRNSPRVVAVCEAAEIRKFTFFEYILIKAASFYVAYPEDVITMTDVHSELKAIEKRYPGLIDDSIDRKFLSTARLTEVLHELVREGVNVRDIRQVIEAVASYVAAYAKSELEPGDFDLHEIITYIRQHRKRHLVGKYLSGRRTLRVVTLSDSIENILIESRDSNSFSKDSELGNLRNTLNTVYGPVMSRGIGPVAILVKPELRKNVYAVLKGLKVVPPVVTYEELDSQLAVESVGVWHVE